MARGDPETVALLEIDPDLGRHLSPDEFNEALSALRLPGLRVAHGEELPPMGDDDLALLVADGLIEQHAVVGTGSALQLLGPGDLFMRTAETARIKASTDAQVLRLRHIVLLRMFRLWPGIATGLLERAADQLNRMARQQAISQLPSVNDRLRSTFWAIADRWGRVTPAGVRIDFGLSQEVLGSLVGAHRSTVSQALKELSQKGILVREPDHGWTILERGPPEDLPLRGFGPAVGSMESEITGRPERRTTHGRENAPR